VIIGLLASIAAVVLKTGVHYFEAWVRKRPAGTWKTIFPGISADRHPDHRILYPKLCQGRHWPRGFAHPICHFAQQGCYEAPQYVVVGGSLYFYQWFWRIGGMEAPIVATGAAIGSNVAQAVKLGHKRTILLIGCGAAAAIAAIFKAPIAGLIFALEVLMLDLTMASIIPLLTVAVTGAIFSAFFLGEGVEFYFTLKDAFNYGAIPFYILLGIIYRCCVTCILPG
jgi:chloride channel protein, CIC family